MASQAALPRVYWYLWTGALINKMGGFVVPFLALYLTRERGISIDRAGLIVSLFGAGSLASGPVGGLLADRMGRKTTMVAALTLGATAMMVLGLARGLPQIGVATLCLGFFGDLYRPAASATIADIVEPAERPRAYSTLYWAVNLGFCISPVIAGLVASRNFTLLFCGDAATTLLYGLIVLVRVPETHPHRAPGLASPEQGRERPPSMLTPFGDPVFMPFVLFSFGLALVFMQHLVTLPLDMRAHGISSARFGAIIAENGLLIVLLQPLVLPLLRRLRRSRMLALGSALSGLGFGMTALVSAAPGYLLTIAIWTLGEIAFSSIGPSVVADLAPPALRGSYQGTYQMAWGGALLVAPAAGSVVFAHFGSRALWGACLLVGLLTAAGHLAIGPARSRRLGGRE